MNVQRTVFALVKRRHLVHDKNMRVHAMSLGIGLMGIAMAVFIATGQVNGLIASFSDTEPVFEYSEEPLLESPLIVDPYANWTRPPGPLRVGIQAGHWLTQEAPEEQEGLRDNTGAQAAGVTEQETNLKIAQQVKTLLEAEGIVVDLLPTTVPPQYLADAFVSIHADGNTDTRINGYKIAAPRRDRSKQAEHFSELVIESYGAATKLAFDANTSRNMRGYYAFNSRRYEHAIHPMVPAIIVETGFITSPTDRAIIVKDSRRSAKGIADGILTFLQATYPTEWRARVVI